MEGPMIGTTPDRISGSLDLLESAAGRIKTHLDRRGTAGLWELLEAIVAEHPSMAVRINLARAVREGMTGGHEGAAEALESFLLGLVRSRLLAAAKFAALVHGGGWKRVATYSRSGQVRECLAAARGAGLSEVMVSEGRPAGEGLILAGELRGEGFAVTLTTDASLFALLPAVQAVVVGADACFEEGFANKVGTAALLREARALGVPSVVLALPEKRLDGSAAAEWRNLPLDKPPRLGKLPRGAVWAGELFEVVPWDLVTHPIGKGAPA
jgi:translation initiation factor eIF-2B subunit delta